MEKWTKVAIGLQRSDKWPTKDKREEEHWYLPTGGGAGDVNTGLYWNFSLQKLPSQQQ